MKCDLLAFAIATPRVTYGKAESLPGDQTEKEWFFSPCLSDPEAIKVRGNELIVTAVLIDWSSCQS